MEDEDDQLQRPQTNAGVLRDFHRGRDSYLFQYEASYRSVKGTPVPVINLYMRSAHFYAFDPKLLSDLDQNSLAGWELPFEQSNGFLYPVAQIPESTSVFSDWQDLMRNFVRVHGIWDSFIFSAHLINSSQYAFSGRFDIPGKKLAQLSLDNIIVPESE